MRKKMRDDIFPDSRIYHESAQVCDEDREEEGNVRRDGEEGGVRRIRENGEEG